MECRLAAIDHSDVGERFSVRIAKWRIEKADVEPRCGVAAVQFHQRTGRYSQSSRPNGFLFDMALAE